MAVSVGLYVNEHDLLRISCGGSESEILLLIAVDRDVM